VAAGFDLCLHLLSLDQGTEASLSAARAMVVPRHRVGNQLQYSPRIGIGTGEQLKETLQWIAKNCSQQISVKQMASRANQSERTFHRHCVIATGMSPVKWLNHRRVQMAARLLEDPELTIEGIAHSTGLGSATNLRSQFRAVLGTTPSEYRAAFHRAPRA